MNGNYLIMSISVRIKNTDHWNWQHLLVILFVTLLCYWPFTFGIFSAKNDNITAFLPTRFHVVEALRSGHLPLWTPYMYLGFPLHGDMQGGAWNPVVWMLSIFGPYHMNSLHAEILLAIFLSGAGMYRLLGTQNLAHTTRLTGSLVYIMSGFITDVGGSNLPFLWAAAFIPFCLAYFVHLLRRPSFKYAACTAVSLFLLLSTAYPAFFILLIYILIAGLMLRIYFLQKEKEALSFRKLFAYLLLTLLLFAGLSAPVIASYLHVLPHYARVDGVSLSQSFVNSFHPACSSSFIFPNLPIKDSNTKSTDLISRNTYFNIFFIVLTIAYLLRPRKRILNFALAGMVFFFLFSLGNFTPVRALCYHFLPLMDTFRHPSNARLLVILPGVFIGAAMLEHPRTFSKQPGYLKWIALILSILILTAIVFTFGRISMIDLWSRAMNHPEGIRHGLKQFFDALGAADLLFFDGIVQLGFLLALLFLLIRKRLALKSFSLLIILNSFIMAQAVLPFTLSSKLPPAVINQVLKSYPSGFPDPGLRSIGENSTDVLAHFDTVGINGFYTRRITLTDVSYTPTLLNEIRQLHVNRNLHSLIMANPYAYFARNITTVPDTTDLKGQVVMDRNYTIDSSNNNYKLVEFGNNVFGFEVMSRDTSIFCLQQLRLPGWRASMDGKNIEILSANNSFMAVKLPPGNHQLKFVYRPQLVLISVYLSLLTLIAIIFLAIKRRNRQHA